MDIDFLKTHPRSLSVYGARLRLEKRGSDYFALCPFHSERTASFSIHSKSGTWMWTCFGCPGGSNSGNIIQFVEKFEKITFKQALEKVQEEIGDNSWEASKDQVDRVFQPPVAEEKSYRTLTLSQIAPLERNLANSGPAKNWLDGRGISMEIAKRLHLGFKQDLGSLGTGLAPEVIAGGWIAFPCIEGDVIKGIKYRSLAVKTFRKQPNMATTLYNLDDIDPLEPVYLVEGECLLGDTEVLTPEGWVRLDNYSGQQVLQWEEQGLRGSFVTPSAFIDKPYDGEMYHFTSKSSLVDQVVTPNHRVLFVPDSPINRDNKASLVLPAKEVKGRTRFYRTANVEAEGAPLTESQIRVQVMIQADASLHRPASNKGRNDPRSNGMDGWQLAVKKDRKKVRARLLLEQAGISYTEHKMKREGYTEFRFNTEPCLYRKIFPSYLYRMDAAQRAAFIDEVPLWDGHTHRSNGSKAYVSIIKANSDLVQTVFVSSGFSAKLGVTPAEGTRSAKYGVSICGRSKRGRHDLTSGSTVKKVSVRHSGRVYCVSVPSGFLLIRRNGVVSVTGNCDAAVMVQAGYRAVSLPSASTTVTAEMKDQLMAADSVILAGDCDGAVGSQIMERLWRDLGDRSVLLKWPLNKKDANQTFLETCGGDVAKFRETVENLTVEAKGSPLPEFTSIQKALLSGGQTTAADHPLRMRFPWTGVDGMALLLPGSVLALTATNTGMGKTVATNQLALHLTRKQNEVVLNYQVELSAIEVANITAAHIVRKERNLITTEDNQKAARLLKDVRYYVGCDPTLNSAPAVLDLLEKAIRRLGATVVILDHIHALCRGDNELRDQAEASRRIKTMAQQYSVKFIVVMQPRKADSKNKGKSLHITDVKGSGALIDDADALFVLHRNVVQNPDPNNPPMDNYEPETEVHCLKARFKGTGSAFTKLYFDGALATFTDITHAEPPPA